MCSTWQSLNGRQWVNLSSTGSPRDCPPESFLDGSQWGDYSAKERQWGTYCGGFEALSGSQW